MIHRLCRTGSLSACLRAIALGAGLGVTPWAVAVTAPQPGAPLPMSGARSHPPTALPALTYRITPRWQATGRHLRVEARVPLNGGTETVLVLPDRFGASRDLHANVRNLDVEGGAVRLEAGPAPARRTLKHAAARAPRTVTLRYELHARPRGPLEHQTFYEPLLEADWLHVLGHALFITPEHLDAAEVAWSVVWDEVPAAWSLAASLGVKQGTRTEWTRARGRLADFQHALYVAGDFRLHTVQIEGRPLRFALRGSWPFTDGQFVEASRSLIATHRAFWDDFDFPDYFISLIPNDIERGSSGGTALTQSFAMHVSRDFTVPGRAFEFLIGHEHLHTWVPQRFGAMGKDEALRYWFSEGFTNFLTHRLLVRGGLWSRARYAEAVNEVIRKYLASPARRYDNRAVADNFWASREAGDMPYQRGELLALRWDAALRRQGSSLDAVLKSLRQPPGGEALATERLSEALARRIATVPADIARFIESGEEAEFTPDLLGPCFELRSAPLEVFDAGFDVQGSIPERTVKGVVQDGPAWVAGLRDGQKILGLNANFGNPDSVFGITVAGEDGTPQKRDFRPARTVGGPVPQYALRPGAEDEAACKASF